MDGEVLSLFEDVKVALGVGSMSERVRWTILKKFTQSMSMASRGTIEGHGDAGGRVTDHGGGDLVSSHFARNPAVEGRNAAVGAGAALLGLEVSEVGIVRHRASSSAGESEWREPNNLEQSQKCNLRSSLALYGNDRTE